jgi:hypothetical protein
VDSKIDKILIVQRSYMTLTYLDKRHFKSICAASTYECKRVWSSVKIFQDLKEMNYSGKGTNYLAIN